MAEDKKLELAIPHDLLTMLNERLSEDDEVFEELAQILFVAESEAYVKRMQGEIIDEAIVKLPDDEQGRKMLLMLRNTIVVLMSRLGNLEKRFLSLLG